MKNKIGWCDMTWNPVWGCRNHCEYCYARKIAKRFYKVVGKREYDPHGLSLPGDGVSLKIDYLKHFVPRFLESQFDKKFPKKPQRIFVGSMSEIYYWEKEWMEKTLNKIEEYPQHTFIFLTKHLRVYNKYTFPSNCWIGFTATKEYSFEENDSYLEDFRYKWHTFISFEPLLEEINTSNIEYLNLDWVIIGAETGNRKDKIIPNRKWVEDIVLYCLKNGIPLYTKDNLKDIYPHQIKEFPEAIK